MSLPAPPLIESAPTPPKTVLLPVPRVILFPALPTVAADDNAMIWPVVSRLFVPATCVTLP